MTSRRASVRLLSAALFVIAAAGHLVAASWRSSPPMPAWPGAAEKFRADGGQVLSARGVFPLNPLSDLALGRRMRLDETGPSFLCALPGLGRKSSLRVAERGELSAREKERTYGYITDTRQP